MKTDTREATATVCHTQAEKMIPLTKTKCISAKELNTSKNRERNNEAWPSVWSGLCACCEQPVSSVGRWAEEGGSPHPGCQGSLLVLLPQDLNKQPHHYKSHLTQVKHRWKSKNIKVICLFKTASIIQLSTSLFQNRWTHWCEMPIGY